MDKPTRMCRLADDTEEEMKKLHLNEQVSALYGQKKTVQRSWGGGRTPRRNENYIHEKAKKCPARGKERYAYKNHFSKFYKTNQVHLIGEESDSDILHIKVDNIEQKLL